MQLLRGESCMLNNNANWFDFRDLNFPKTYAGELALKNNDKIFKAAICMCYLPTTINYFKAVQLFFHDRSASLYLF